MKRIDLQFPVAGDDCAAWLYEPETSTPAPAPIVVMAHGLTGTRRDRLGAFAERFAAAGCAALVFDHRGFGDAGGEPDLFHPVRQLEDWAAAIACARSIELADPDRVVTFGSSMGGGNALAAAASDPRVAGAISQVPFLDITTQAFRAAPGVLEEIFAAAQSGRHLPAVGQPDQAALLNAPGAETGWRHVVAIGEDSRWRNRVSTAWLLDPPPFRPVEHAATLHCPWLVCVGEADQVAAPGPAIEAAMRAPHSELRIYPGVDHFDIYDGPDHEALIADQLAFLDRHVLLGADHARQEATA